MQNELNEFERKKFFTLVPRPNDRTIIRTKLVFFKKCDEDGKVACNKARLVAKGYNQEKDIDYEETFASIAKIEAIRMLLVFLLSCILSFIEWILNVLF